MQTSKSFIAVVGLLAGFVLSRVSHRPPVDLNMDGAPPVTVPGYTGPVYDAKGSLIGYAQPKIVNLTLPGSVSSGKETASTRNFPAASKLASVRPAGPTTIASH